MKRIDYSEIMKEAERKEISPFLLVKRKYNYREAKITDVKCKRCKMANEVNTTRGRYFQCITIGVGCDGYSEINPEYTCDASILK